MIVGCIVAVGSSVAVGCAGIVEGVVAVGCGVAGGVGVWKR
jgi:hypothetical protein